MSNLSSVSGGPSLSSDSKPLPPSLLVPQSSSSEQQPQAQQQQQQTAAGKRKRSLPGTPDPDAEVIALSPRTLLTTNRFVCEICNKGFQRDQNLQLHRRGHNLPWKLKQRSGKDIRKRVYICPETSCVHHDPARALGDLTGVKKHFCRKHGEKKWKCEKCSKRYAVQSDWKAHSKTCGTREYRCDCGTLFSRRDSFITHRAFCDALAEESVRASAGGMALPHMPAGIPTAPSGSVLLGHGSTVLQHHHHHQHHHNQQQQQASASSLSLYRTTAGGGAGIFRTGPAQQFPFSVRSSNCVPPARPHLSLWPETAEDQQQQQHIPNAAGFFTATKPGMLAGLHDYEEPCKSMVNMMPSSCSSTHNSNNTSSNNNNTNNGTGGGGATVSAGHSLYSNILNSVVLNSSSDTDFGAVANWPDRPPAASASRLSLSNSSASTDNYNNNNNNSSSNNSNNTNSNATNNMDSIYSNMNVNLYANMSGLPQMSATALLQKAAQMGATASSTGNAAAFGMAGSENAAPGAGGGHVSLALAGAASTSQQQQHHHHHHNPFSLLSSDHQHQQHQQHQQQQQQGLKISESAAAELMMSSMFNNLSDTGALNKLMMNMAAAAGSSSSAAAMAEQERLTRDFLGVGAPFMPPPPGSHMDHFVMYSRDSNTGHAPAAVAAAAAAAKSSMKATATATSPSTSWDATA